ncbi:heavy metal translocating P-type ATPase [Pedobacter immunditicola]|uniref:heavy metal translocating P-type ATPase n=1 Tax=Pedobacter immunditicola TaxID=3133440 RepID=UPI0030B4430F
MEAEENIVTKPPHTSEQQHDHNHDHPQVNHKSNNWTNQWPLLTALLVLIVMLTLEYGFNFKFNTPVEFVIYGSAYLLSGYKVIQLAFRKAMRLDFFNEFVLMTVATLGAFAIGSFSEGVAVMVFYAIGEWFQDAAVDKAKRNIKALLDIRPDKVTVIRAGQTFTTHPDQVKINEVIQIKPGEKVALDGILLSEKGTFNTAAMTGESVPDAKINGTQVLAGMININTLVEVRVSSLFKDSKLSKILEMVQDAAARKSQTQLFISRFAKVYTPIVFLLALMVVVLPFFFVTNYEFQDWFYRGLVFLVISCPCALVVSIPLGYFGGIGLASKNGILFKGSNFLDVMTKVDTVVMDKTGTLTKGVFKVQALVSQQLEYMELLVLTAALESKSTHPIAVAITDYAKTVHADLNGAVVEQVEEIAGHGLKGVINGKNVLAGNGSLLRKFNIPYDTSIDAEAETVVLIAVDEQYAGYLRIADELKADAAATIKALHQLNIATVMLSGDKQSVVNKVAKTLGIDKAYGALLPEDKVEKVAALKANGNCLAFVGDGVNDAPVIALADAGIAMGGLGSDATIETADVVIQNDQPYKIVTAIKIGKLTRNVVWQNITLAMGVKILVLVLGAGGVASLWEAVIADVGVALLAILNAVRIQHSKVH